MATSYPGFDRITHDPAMLGGKPCVRGMRISVQQLLQILADYPDWDELQAEYPELEREDIPQALSFAAKMMDLRVQPFDLNAA